MGNDKPEATLSLSMFSLKGTEGEGTGNTTRIAEYALRLRLYLNWLIKMKRRVAIMQSVRGNQDFLVKHPVYTYITFIYHII